MNSVMHSPVSSARRRRSNKEKERNLGSSVLCMLVIALLSTALAQPRWFYLKGGVCPHTYLGVYEFFDLGTNADEKHPAPNKYDGRPHEIRDPCITLHIVAMMRLVIAFSFFGIMTSLFAFILDTVGVSNAKLKSLRRNAVGSVFSVFFTVVIIGLCYYITTLIEQQQELMKPRPGSKVEVKFDISFYLVTAAGSVSVLATAANLLHKVHGSEDDSMDGGLLEDYDGLETFSVGYPNRLDVSPMHFMPPPPPYSP